MINLRVYIEICGVQTFVGTISGTNTANAVFTYSTEYLEREHCVPISVMLPLQEKPFLAETTRLFFEGLLPEGFVKQSLAQSIHADENDYIAILSVLGQECLGAIQILPENTPTENMSYEKLTFAQVHALAAEGASLSAELVLQSHLSLTGASGKVGLYYDFVNDNWYLPKGLAPSTHIVKQSHIRYHDIVINEQLSLLTARKLGVQVVDSFIINTGIGTDKDVLIAVSRYDRQFSDECRKTCGLPIPFRLHQEDFSQALAIPSSEKYERDNHHYMKKMFDSLMRYSSDPITDRLRLWDMMIFNRLIGNTDAHLKNYSLCYSADLQSIRLAPAYDIISTKIYDGTSRQLAISIGGQHILDLLTRDDFENAAREIGLGLKIALARFDEMHDAFPSALSESASYLADLGFGKAIEIKNKILG